MSMPTIDLETIPPRDALAAIMASIALQEAAIAHVLNAEGEKIQAVVNLEDATLEDLQGINESVGTLVGNVSSLAGEIQRKLRTAMEALYPSQLPVVAATLTVRIIDEGGNPVSAAGALFTLIDTTNPLIQFTSFPVGSSVRVNNIPPGLYTLHQTQATSGYQVAASDNLVEVLSDGSIRFDGLDASLFPPTVVNHTAITEP